MSPFNVPEFSPLGPVAAMTAKTLPVAINAAIIGKTSKAFEKRSHHVLPAFCVLGSMYIAIAIGARTAKRMTRICRKIMVRKAISTAKNAVPTKLKIPIGPSAIARPTSPAPASHCWPPPN